MAYTAAVREEAIRLRVEEKLGLGVIAARLGVSKGSASQWLREHPLPDEVLQQKQSARGSATRGRRKVCQPTTVQEVSTRFRDTVQGRTYTSHQMGALAETAVLFRLYLHQFEVFRSAADGAKVDWVVVDPKTGRTMKVQVKCVHKTREGRGLPTVSLRCADGTKNGSKPMKARRYREDEFDFIVGYDLRTDICYVWSHAETVSYRSAVTISEGAAERWDKLSSGCSAV